MGRLFWKFFLFLFFAQLTTALGVGAFIQFKANDQARKARIDQSPISQNLIEAAQLTLETGGLERLKQLLQRWDEQHARHRIYVIDDKQQDVISRKVPADLAAKAIRPKNNRNRSVANVMVDGQPYYIFVATKRPNRRAGNRIQHQPPFEPGMAPPPDRRKPPALLRTFSNFPLKALMIAAIASALFAAILAWYFSKPISSLRTAFKQAADGDLNVRVGDQMGSRNDELSDLGHHFDYMAKRLQALVQGQTRLLHHVSHELRSPLARMQMALGLAIQSPEKAQSSLDRIDKEAGRMDKLIGELLELSRFESGMVDLAKERFSLNDMLKTIVEDANFEASKKQIEIVAEIPALITFHGQPDLIYRAIENVVRNAVKYGPEESIVSINCLINKDENNFEIAVKDTGAGVFEDELEDVFKPFIRGNSGSQVKGHGVGLAITKQVVEAHGGHVFARNRQPNGFCVTMVFPESAYSISPET